MLKNKGNIMINPITINPVHVEKIDSSAKDRPAMINPIDIDPDFKKKQRKTIKNSTVLTHTKMINPIEIVDVPLDKPIKTQSDKYDSITEKYIANVAKTQNLSNGQNVSKESIRYIFSNQLSLNALKMLNPQMGNSIGAANALLEILPEIIYNEKEKQFYEWNSKYWEKLSDGELKKICAKLIEHKYNLVKLNSIPTDTVEEEGKTPVFNAMIDMIKNKRNRMPHQFNTASKVICLKNGVFDFNDCQLHRFDEFKENYITNFVNCSYKPLAKSQVLDAFLNSIMGDAENVKFLQQIFGYAIIGEPKSQVGFILEGSGSNGKSTLLAAIHNLLETYTGTLPVSYFTGDSLDLPNRPSPETFSIKDKLIIYTSEAQSNSFLNESKIKKFIGGGKLIARPPYGQLVEFENRSTLFFDTNHLPHFKDGGYSMERRLLVIPFPYTFTKDTADINLLEKLKTPHAQEALLAWLIEGAISYIKHGGFNIPPRVIEATTAFFKEEDTVGQFIEDCIITDNTSSVRFSTLYSAYTDYCEINSLTAVNRDSFSKSKRMQQFPNTRNSKGRFRKGLRLKEI